VQGQLAPPALGEAFHERPPEQVNGDAPRGEFQSPVRQARPGQVLRQVGILDHEHLSVDGAEIAQLFHGIVLGQGLGGHLRAREVVQA
jgi:hypothetical protein